MDVSDNWGTPRQDTGIAFHASRNHISQLVLGGDVLGHPSGAPAQGYRGSPPPACWIGRRSRQLHKAASTSCSFHTLFSLRMRGLDGISLLGGCHASFTLEPTRSPPIIRPPRPPRFPSRPAGPSWGPVLPSVQAQGETLTGGPGAAGLVRLPPGSSTALWSPSGQSLPSFSPSTGSWILRSPGHSADGHPTPHLPEY